MWTSNEISSFCSFCKHKWYLAKSGLTAIFFIYYFSIFVFRYLSFSLPFIGIPILLEGDNRKSQAVFFIPSSYVIENHAWKVKILRFYEIQLSSNRSMYLYAIESWKTLTFFNVYNATLYAPKCESTQTWQVLKFRMDNAFLFPNSSAYGPNHWIY